MGSGDRRPARGRRADARDSQGALEGILPPEEPRADTATGEATTQPEPGRKRGSTKPVRSPRNDAGENGIAPLLASLDALEENVTLLLARHESLAVANAAAEERRQSRDSLDPIELERRVHTLEAEKARLERHAAFLESRIRGLLSRVRYVIES